MKKGVHTTEFWLSFLAMILGFVMASGLLPSAALAVQIVGGAVAILAKLGYTAARTSAKNTAELAKAVASSEDEDSDPS